MELNNELSGVIDPESGEVFSILVCDACGLGQTEPQPIDLAPYYREYYGNRHGRTALFRATRRLALVEASFKDTPGPKQILDIGCGSGEFLTEAKKKGWSTVGTEMSEEVPPGLTVYSELSEVKADFGLKSFDAVTLWHSLEHFRNPKQILLEVGELLKDDGRLLVAVPDRSGLQARIFGKHWFHLDVPRHLFHFGRDSLKGMLEENGFKVIRAWHQEFEYDLLGWSQSLMNKFFRTPNVFFKILTGKTTSVNQVTNLAHVAFGLGFTVAAVPLVLVGTSLRKGGTLVFLVTRDLS